MSYSRSEVVTLARSWIGTPYQHQASLKGVGCDCLGLVRGVWQSINGGTLQPVPRYTRDWGEVARRETLLEAARDNLVECRGQAPRLGDVIVFRLRPDACAKHVGLYCGEGRMIHAQEGNCVSEVALGRWWTRRMAGIFCFPNIVD